MEKWQGEEMKGLTLERIREVSEGVTDSEGLELVDIQLLGGGSARLLRLYIDKPEGVTHEDCENVSRKVGALLDAEDLIPDESYTLEVSSPGIERPLMKPKDYQRFLGQKIRIVLKKPIEKRKKFDGLLAAFENEVVTLEPEQGEAMRIPMSEIDKANLKYEW